MKNTVTLYGKIVSAVEFRSKVNDDCSELYECLVEVQNKSIHGGTIRNIGKSLICLIYKLDRSKEKSELQSNQDKLWFSLQNGQCVKVNGIVVQDRINKLGTSSVLISTLETLDHLEETQGNASVIVSGKVYKNPPSMKSFKNKSEKLTFLIDQTEEGVSMKMYVVAWNNLANYINDLNLQVGDEVEIVGNLVSRSYHDKDSGEDVNLCELLAKRLNKVEVDDIDG